MAECRTTLFENGQKLIILYLAKYAINNNKLLHKYIIIIVDKEDYKTSTQLVESFISLPRDCSYVYYLLHMVCAFKKINK